MRPVIATFFLALAVPASAGAAEFSGYAVLTTDYVFRGVTYSDSDPAFQLGADLNFDSGLYMGVWGSTTDISGRGGAQRDYQVNYYVGYGYQVSNDWTLTANALLYTYPGATGTIDYDYEEFAVTLNYQDLAWFEVAWAPDYYSADRTTLNYDLFVEFPIAWDLYFGFGGGYYDVSDFSGSGYGYWQAGVARSFGLLDLDLRFHDTNRWVPSVSNAERAGSRVSLSARIQF